MPGLELAIQAMNTEFRLNSSVKVLTDQFLPHRQYERFRRLRL